MDNSSKLLIENIYSKNTYSVILPPIETFNIDTNVKCFTYFSYLSKIWRDIRINLSSIYIYIRPQYNWIPPHMVDRFYLAVHSPKTIPESDYGTNFFEVKVNKMSSVTFIKMNVDVKDNCQNYDDEYLRSDCIDICILKKLQDKYGRHQALLTGFLFRKYFSKILEKFNKTLYKILDSANVIDLFKPECMRQCKQDCLFEYYVHVVSIGREEEKHFELERKALVLIRHKQIPDIYIKNIPEMTFISFVSNFGGLLGMWLGISVILIFENTFQLMKPLFEHFTKPKPTNLFIQNTQNNLFLTENISI